MGNEDKRKEQEIIEKNILNDRYLQDSIRDLQESEKITKDLNSELLGILEEMEGSYYDTSEGNKYRNFETQDIPYRVLRRIGDTEPARLIKNKRRLDLSQYSRVPRADGVQRGTKLVFNNADYNPSKEEKAILKNWEKILVDNFFFSAMDDQPSFSKFLGAAYEDWFDMDDITVEYRRDGLGRLLSIHLQDPMLYKPVIKQSRMRSIYDRHDAIIEDYLKDYSLMYEGEKKLDEDIEPDYLLIYQNRRIAGVTSDVLRKYHMFTRTNFRTAKRGYSVVEQGMNMVSYIMGALKMNASNFSNNRLPDGLLAFTKGGAGTLQLEKLKKVLTAYMSGSNNRNRFPMISLMGEGDAKWISTRSSSKDMEYHLWVTLLFSIWCQLSGTDPKEVSLGSHSEAVGKDSLFKESSDGIIKESRDIGAKNFLNFISDSLNTPDKKGTNIFQEVTGLDVRLDFIGFEFEDKKNRMEITQKELQTNKTLNELLANEDKEEFELKIGDVNIYDVPAIQNPQIFQAVMFKAQMEMQQKQQQQQMHKSLNLLYLFFDCIL